MISYKIIFSISAGITIFAMGLLTAQANFWQSLNGPPGAMVHKLVIDDNSDQIFASFYGPRGVFGRLLAGTHRSGVYRTVSSTTAGEQENPKMHFVLDNNFPNPFTEQTWIPFEIGKQAHVQLDIFDTRGKLVINLLDKILLPGAYTVPFEAKNCLPGLYLYRLAVEKVESIGKALKVP